MPRISPGVQQMTSFDGYIEGRILNSTDDDDESEKNTKKANVTVIPPGTKGQATVGSTSFADFTHFPDSNAVRHTHFKKL